MQVMSKLPPSAFYQINHHARWQDEFSDSSGGERLILTPEELRAKHQRDSHYATWCVRRQLPSRQMKWQSIRILTQDHADRTAQDWWDLYRECTFKVFIQPYTMRDPRTNEYRQWYVLAPEESEMVLRFEMEKLGFIQPPRNFQKNERWVSRNRNISKALCVPVECCHQCRHETVGGEVPMGL